MANEVTVLGGGCFWCLEAVFDEMKGVLSVESGYTGGIVDNPSYKQICTGATGHTEVIHVTFDNSVISFRDILNVFFTIHDPTTLNRQGADAGTQYRSAIYYTNEAQKQTAQEVIAEFTEQKIWSNPIVTEVTALPKFYIAESYHQEYFKKNPYDGYCQVVVAPKVAKFRKLFLERVKA